MGISNPKDRYKHEHDKIVVEVAVKNVRHLFNERDPAPFRERDLDPQFVIYLMSAVEEFPLRTPMKIRIVTATESDLLPDAVLTTRESIQSYFEYESVLAKSKLMKRHRTARFFFLIGVVTLFVCLSLAQFVSSFKLPAELASIISAGFIITGWVAMWHPIEALLYEWWPSREQRRYFDKIAHLEVELALPLQSL